jgi:H+/Cl- antiporter ClcA
MRNIKGMDMRMILTAGVAARFGAVFRTSLTDAAFAMEVLAIGRIKYDSHLPTLIAAILGDIERFNSYPINASDNTSFPISDLSRYILQ